MLSVFQKRFVILEFDWHVFSCLTFMCLFLDLMLKTHFFFFKYFLVNFSSAILYLDLATYCNVVVDRINNKDNNGNR